MQISISREYGLTGWVVLALIVGGGSAFIAIAICVPESGAHVDRSPERSSTSRYASVACGVVGGGSMPKDQMSPRVEAKKAAESRLNHCTDRLGSR